MADYAKSCIAVAEYNLSISEGDLELARNYLETVAASNSEEVVRAGELLKIAERAIEERERSILAKNSTIEASVEASVETAKDKTL